MATLFKYIFPTDKDLFKKVFILATPVIISNISRVLMGIIDMAMIGHLGGAAIAGVGMGGMVTWTIISLGIAFRTGTQTFASRRLGQKKYNECSIAMRNMQAFAFLIGIPITLFFYTYTIPIMSFFLDTSTDAFKSSIDYAAFGFLGTYFVYVMFIFQGFYTGIEKTKIHMKATLSANLLNLYLNIGLIFGTDSIVAFLDGSGFEFFGMAWGFYNFPAMGVKGAAIGTFIAIIWQCIHYALYLFNDKIKIKYEVFKLNINLEMLKKQLVVAYPLAFQEILIMFSFTIFYKILGIIGIAQLAATQVIFKIMHASFMPAIGVGQACATLVGKYLGEENPDKAETAVKESLRGAFLIMGTVGVVFACFSQYIIPLFTNDESVIMYAIPGLRFVGLLQFADAVCFTLWFALTGAGDTKIPAIVDVLTHWVLFVPACYIFGIYLGYGFWGPWISFGLHLTVFAIFMYVRFNKGKWKTIKV